MKKYLIVASVALAIIAALVILLLQNKRLRRERDAYRNNTEVLLGEIERYETKSGEQAVRWVSCSCGWRNWSGTAPTMPH